MQSIVHQSGTCRDSTSLFFLDSKLQNALRFNTCNGSTVKSEQRFVYDGGKIYIIDTSMKLDKDTVIVDSALRILEHHPSKGSPEMVAHFVYSQKGLLEYRIEYFSGMSTGDTTHYAFNNGDLIESGNKQITTQYTYYEKEVPTSGFLTQQGLAYGSAFFIKNKHLLKEVIENNVVTVQYNYEFDSYGNVSKKTAATTATGLIETTTYNYLCAIP
jgi:hypothetical protein